MSVIAWDGRRTRPIDDATPSATFEPAASSSLPAVRSADSFPDTMASAAEASRPSPLAVFDTALPEASKPRYFSGLASQPRNWLSCSPDASMRLMGSLDA